MVLPCVADRLLDSTGVTVNVPGFRLTLTISQATLEFQQSPSISRRNESAIASVT